MMKVPPGETEEDVSTTYEGMLENMLEGIFCKENQTTRTFKLLYIADIETNQRTVLTN